MVEFTVALLGFLVLLMMIVWVAGLVREDFEKNIYYSREQVANQLASSQGGNATYSLDEDTVLAMEEVLNSGNYSARNMGYTTSRADGFQDFKTQEMASEASSVRVDVEFDLLQRILGRGYVKMENQVYMPPWDNLLE